MAEQFLYALSDDEGDPLALCFQIAGRTGAHPEWIECDPACPSGYWDGLAYLLEGMQGTQRRNRASLEFEHGAEWVREVEAAAWVRWVEDEPRPGRVAA
jgi:hypothetical protein